jgi:hypothetical protein
MIRKAFPREAPLARGLCLEYYSLMKWITRSHVHVDRVACPWLITRFIDSEAEFLFVPASQVDRTAKETGAIPFDVPGAALGHVDGRCSFESIILAYGLKDPGLLRLARIVHAADIQKDIGSDPLARGLEAVASGFSLRFPEDGENLSRQFDVYDSLYAWCRMDADREPSG